jgi:hypothetical protein
MKYAYWYSIYWAKKYNSLSYIQILPMTKYLHSTKSCDISQLKIDNCRWPNQHSPIGHWQKLKQIPRKDLQATPKVFEKEIIGRLTKWTRIWWTYNPRFRV